MGSNIHQKPPDEDGLLYITLERKYYHRGLSFIKRSLRESEYFHGIYGICVPALNKERLQNEAECLRYLRSNTDIPVPTVYADFEDDGAYYLITEYIQGVDMFELPQEKKDIVKQELDRHLSTLHSLKSKTPGGPSGLVIPPRPVLDRSKQYSWALKTSDKENYVFCHNDLSEYNVLVDPKTLKITAIIDWEYAGFYPDFFEAPLYKRRGTGARTEDDGELVLRQLEFLTSQSVTKGD